MISSKLITSGTTLVIKILICIAVFGLTVEEQFCHLLTDLESSLKLENVKRVVRIFRIG